MAALPGMSLRCPRDPSRRRRVHVTPPLRLARSPPTSLALLTRSHARLTGPRPHANARSPRNARLTRPPASGTSACLAHSSAPSRSSSALRHRKACVHLFHLSARLFSPGCVRPHPLLCAVAPPFYAARKEEDSATRQEVTEKRLALLQKARRRSCRVAPPPRTASGTAAGPPLHGLPRARRAAPA